MSLNVQALARTMLDAARAAVAGRWPQLEVLAEVEIRGLAHSLAELAARVASGEIKETHARQLVYMHQNTARTVLQTVEGIALLTAQQAIDAAVRAVADKVNCAAKAAML